MLRLFDALVTVDDVKIGSKYPINKLLYHYQYIILSVCLITLKISDNFKNITRLIKNCEIDGHYPRTN